jgi:uncharacterized membrane protein YoaK (UPF0700 family)
MTVATDPLAERDARRRDTLVVALAVNSGAVDALGFLALGGAFTSVMTGNMVLLGLSGARHDGSAAAHAGLAIVFFMFGCTIGARIAGPARKEQPIWPNEVNRAFAVQAALTLAFSVGWWSADDHPRGDPQLALLVINAVSLGMQSTTVQRFGVPGLSTTYLTGTLTTLVGRLSHGHKLRDVGHSGLLLLGLIGGAVASGLLVLHAPWAAPILPLVCVGSIVVLGNLLMNDAVRSDRLVQ